MHLKPPIWNVSPALVAPEARALWKDVAFVAPLWGGAGKGALLNALGQPLAGANLVAGSTLERRGTPYGLGVGISGASNLLTQTDFAPVTTSDGAGTGDFTVLILANPPAESRASAGVSQKSSAGTPRLDVVFNSNTGLTASSGTLSLISGGGGGTYPSLANAVDGLYHLFAGQRAGAELSLWVDGAKRASTTTSVNDVWSDITGFSIGNLGESASGARISTTTNIVFAAGWNRALSDAEMRMLARDPFCMFRPMPEWRGVWRGVAGGDVVLQPSDILDGLSFASPTFSQAHVLSGSEWCLAENLDTPTLGYDSLLSPAKLTLVEGFESVALSQSHLFPVDELRSLLAFDAALLTAGGGVAPGFRSRTLGVDTRQTGISNRVPSLAASPDDRSRSIKE